MIPNDQFIEAVGERDIDLLLLEEFYVSEAFQAWFARKVLGEEATHYRFKEAWHSMTHPKWGESDLLAIYESHRGQRMGILIENKVYADAQPEQASRYLKRGEAGVTDGRWNDFRTCIVAPSRYAESAPDAQGYQARITYEEFRELFSQLATTDRRYLYRKRLVDEAIEQNRRGYQPDDHPAVHQFWQEYWTLVKDEFPELTMTRPKERIPFKSDWPRLHLAGVRRGRSVVHKWRHGYVDLEIRSAGNRVDEIRQRITSLLDADMTVEQTGKTAVIRLEVPSVDRLGSFGAQVEAVRAGLQAAKRLLGKTSEIEVP